MILSEPHQKRPRRIKNKKLNAFGNYIKEKRIMMNLTQRELADMSGISYSFIQDIERGIVNLRLSKVLELITAIGGEIIIRDRIVDQAIPFDE